MLVSIIVPVYNTEKYLDECIQSILDQTYSNFELLLINDGSSDRSGEICDKYALKDERIKVFHQKNEGVSTARNLGLDHATGEWITFVDSDDYIGQDYISEFVKLEREENIIYLNTTKIINGNKTNIFSIKNSSYTIKNFVNKYMITSLGYVHSKFFKRKPIHEHKIRFDNNLSFAEDCLFILELLKFSDSIFLSDINKYYYRDTPGSLVKKIYSYEKELYLLKQAKAKIQEIFECHKLNIQTFLLEKELQNFMHRVIRSNSFINDKEVRILNLKNIFREFKDEMLYIYKESKGIGLLLYLTLKFSNIYLYDFIIRIIYKNKQSV